MQRTLIDISPGQAIGFCLAVSLFELLTYMASDLIMPAMLAVTLELSRRAACSLRIQSVPDRWCLPAMADRSTLRPFWPAAAAVERVPVVRRGLCRDLWHQQH
jgi:hypothetical protein